MVEDYEEDDNDIEPEDKIYKSPKIPKYEELVQEEPAREVNLEEEYKGGSITESEENTEQKTDLQTAMNKLLPKFFDKKLDKVLQPAMVSRIFPDNYTDRLFLTTAYFIEEREPDEDIPFLEILSAGQDALSIGYEGRGRVDILEVAGVAHEEEMEKLSKELGL